MEPITTSIAISAVVGYLAKKIGDDKSIQGFLDDFTEATVNWIKPLFIKEDGTPQKVLEDLQANPSSIPRQEAVKNSIEIALENAPQSQTLLMEMLKIIQQKESSIAEGSTTINQRHTGSGNNIGGSQTNNYYK